MNNADFVPESESDDDISEKTTKITVENNGSDLNALGSLASCGDTKSSTDTEVYMGSNPDETSLISDNPAKTSQENAINTNSDTLHTMPTAQCPHTIAIGSLVEVQPRTWPGINKQGGSGRVTAVYIDTSSEEPEVYYDVRYVLGGIDKHIEEDYVELSTILNKHAVRRRKERDFYHNEFSGITKVDRRRKKEKLNKEEIEQPPNESTIKRYPRINLESRNEANDKYSSIDIITSDVLAPNIVLSGNSHVTSHKSEKGAANKIKSSTASRTAATTKILPSSSTNIDSVSSESDDTNIEYSRQSNKISRIPSPKPSRVKKSRHTNLSISSESDYSSDNESIEYYQRIKHKRRKATAKYIKGYDKELLDDGSFNDDDLNFIQPEDDATGLPSDFDIGITLANTTSELKKQLRSTFNTLKRNTRWLESEKNRLDETLSAIGEITIEELRIREQEAAELGFFSRKKLVQEGVDAMNQLFNALAKKGIHDDKLDAQMVLTFDDYVSMIHDLCSWTKHYHQVIEKRITNSNNGAAARNETVLLIQSSDNDSQSWLVIDNNSEYKSDTSSSSESSLSSNTKHPGYIDEEHKISNKHIDKAMSQTPQNAIIKNQRRKAQKKRPFPFGERPKRNPYRISKSLDDFGFVLNDDANKLESDGEADLTTQAENRIKKFQQNHERGEFSRLHQESRRWRWIETTRFSSQKFSQVMYPRMKSQISLPKKSVQESKGRIGAKKANIEKSVHDEVRQLRSKRSRQSKFNSLGPFSSVHKSDFTVREINTHIFETKSSTHETSSDIGMNPGFVYNNELYLSSPKANSHVESMLDTSVQEFPICWSRVFKIISGGLEVNHSLPITPGLFIQISNGLDFDLSNIHSQESSAISWALLEGNLENPLVKLCAHLRQQLNVMLLREYDYMESKFTDSNNTISLSKIAPGVTSSHHYESLTSEAKDYCYNLSKLFTKIKWTLHEIPACLLSKFVLLCLKELSIMLCQLPDCGTLFRSCPNYFVHFNNCCQDGINTPYLTALMYFYKSSIQLVTEIESMCAAMCLSQDLKSEIEIHFKSILSTNRIVLSAATFLFDLYIHIPKSHQFINHPLSSSSSSQAPFSHLNDHPPLAVSLWLCIYYYFKNRPAESGEQYFWTFIQCLYDDHRIDFLAHSFLQPHSSVVYTKHFYVAHDNDNSEIRMESKLLALVSTWEVCLTLAYLLQLENVPEQHIPSNSAAKWALVESLLQANGQKFLPWKVSDKDLYRNDDFADYVSNLRRKVLGFIFTLSTLWEPNVKVLARLLQEFWVPAQPHFTSVDELRSQLPFILYEVAKEVDKLNQLNLLHTESEASTQNRRDSVSMNILCKIIMIQLSKITKRIQFRRYRQPLINEIKERIRKISQSSEVPLVKWNWQNDKNILDGTAKQSIIKRSSLNLLRSDFCVASSVMLVLLIGSFHCDKNTPSQRRWKELLRDIQFFCDEIYNTLTKTSNLELLCQCFHIIGILSVESSQAMSIVFSYLHRVLKLIFERWQSNQKILDRQIKSVDRMTVRMNTSSTISHRLQQEVESQLIQLGLWSCMKVLEDLSRRIRSRSMQDPTMEEIQATHTIVRTILNDGLAQCFEFLIQKKVPYDVHQAVLRILDSLWPREPNEPRQSKFKQIPTAFNNVEESESSEYDDFGDFYMLESIDVTHPCWTKEKIIAQMSSSFRLALQRLVINYPYPFNNARKSTHDGEELVIDIFGSIISLEATPFSWQLITSAPLSRLRMLPSRLLSSILKSFPEKKWFSRCFLSEQKAGQALIMLWLTSSLDFKSLLPTVSSTVNDPAVGEVIPIRYCDSWLMLTDSIVAQLPEETDVERYKIDSYLYQILRNTVLTCGFSDAVSSPNGLTRTSRQLFQLHVRVIRAMCASAQLVWCQLKDNSTKREEIHQFRQDLLSPTDGVFVSIVESYLINMKLVCSTLDDENCVWYNLASKFVQEFATPISSESLHAFDDINADSLLEVTSVTNDFTPAKDLLVLLKFMYTIVDCFLFYCGNMAIGQRTIFGGILELMFCQAYSVEHESAKQRLELHLTTAPNPKPVATRVKYPYGDISAGCLGFVERVRLYFASQKYPSLIRWFAQTLEIYQTIKGGWITSPLRILLLNILDPEGELGAHSYVPLKLVEQQRSDAHKKEPPIVLNVRRLAFYMSCGLLPCTCTKVYEHSFQRDDVVYSRLKDIRVFIWNEFVAEVWNDPLQDGQVSFRESLLPLCQFAKAFLNHCKLNRFSQDNRTCTPHENVPYHFFQVEEMYPFFHNLTLYFIECISLHEAMFDVLQLILLIEFCGILRELISLVDETRNSEIFPLLEIALLYVNEVSTHLELLSHENQPEYPNRGMKKLVDVKLPAYLATYNIHTWKMSSRNNGTQCNTTKSLDYGIGLIHIRLELFSAIQVLQTQCTQTKNDPINGLPSESIQLG